jgi:hypothetical protein
MVRQRKPGVQGTGSPSPDKDRSAHEAKRGAKQARPKLSELSYAPLTSEEYAVAVRAISDETDRGCAIMGCALVEEALTSLLSAALENRDEQHALFRDNSGPFNSMMQRTLAAYALGLCNRKLKDDIDIVRNIRNQFSHALRVIDFSTPEIEREVNKLPEFILINIAGQNLPPEGSPRYRFEAACDWIALTLNRKATLLFDKRAKALTQSVQVDPEARGDQSGGQDTLDNFGSD